jgi:4-hydroxy-2-oxoglutarate aldolase
MAIDLRGVFVPATSPFDPVTGEIDPVGMRGNVRHWIDRGVTGILVAGSTGESVFLDESERVHLTEACRGAMPDGAPLVVGTGLESTRATIRLNRAVADAGADAVLVQPPAFFKGAMSPDVLRDHYRAVADAAPLPVLLYQCPLRLSTLEFPTGLVAELSSHPNIVGIKDSRGNLELLGELVEQTQEGFQVLVGSGALLYGALVTGAVGGILAVAAMAPAESAEIYGAFTSGRSAAAGSIQERIAPVHNGIVGGMGVPGVKAAMDLLGLRGGAPRPPLGPLPEARMGELRQILDDADLLQPAEQT